MPIVSHDFYGYMQRLVWGGTRSVFASAILDIFTVVCAAALWYPCNLSRRFSGLTLNWIDASIRIWRVSGREEKQQIDIVLPRHEQVNKSKNYFQRMSI